jgi:exopolysaccharide biosynthesis protein
MYQSTNLPIYRFLCLILLLASGCAFFQSPPAPTPLPTPTPTPLPTPIRWPTTTPEPPDTGWQLLQPGVELRRMLVEADSAAADGGEYLAIVRLDPSAVYFRVHYNPGQPLKVSAWAERLQSLMVVNGGYFTPEHEATGLLISDGQTWGAVYGDFAGFFAVTADGRVSVRWLRDRPYDPTEPLMHGVMSFPVLVKPGGAMGFPADADDGTSARRTVVAQDFAGRILFIAAPRGTLSLHRMAIFLAESHLDIDVALNLDGGPSTGMWLQSGENPVGIDSHTAVPSIISVEIR